MKGICTSPSSARQVEPPSRNAFSLHCPRATSTVTAPQRHAVPPARDCRLRGPARPAGAPRTRRRRPCAAISVVFWAATSGHSYRLCRAPAFVRACARRTPPGRSVAAAIAAPKDPAGAPANLGTCPPPSLHAEAPAVGLPAIRVNFAEDAAVEASRQASERSARARPRIRTPGRARSNDHPAPPPPPPPPPPARVARGHRPCASVVAYRGDAYVPSVRATSTAKPTSVRPDGSAAEPRVPSFRATTTTCATRSLRGVVRRHDRPPALRRTHVHRRRRERAWPRRGGGPQVQADDRQLFVRCRRDSGRCTRIACPPAAAPLATSIEMRGWSLCPGRRAASPSGTICGAPSRSTEHPAHRLLPRAQELLEPGSERST